MVKIEIKFQKIECVSEIIEPLLKFLASNILPFEYVKFKEEYKQSSLELIEEKNLTIYNKGRILFHLKKRGLIRRKKITFLVKIGWNNTDLIVLSGTDWHTWRSLELSRKQIEELSKLLNTFKKQFCFARIKVLIHQIENIERSEKLGSR